MCSSRKKVPSEEFRRDFPREWAAVSTTDGHRIQDWGISGGMASLLGRSTINTWKTLPFPVFNLKNPTFSKGKSDLNLNFHDFGVQKLLMFQGVLLSFRLQFDETLWISSEGKWLGKFCFLFFHVMKWMYFFCFAFLQQLVLPLKGNRTCVGWHDPWSMVAFSLSEWWMGWLSPARFLRNHKKINQKKRCCQPPIFEFLWACMRSGWIFRVLPCKFSGV